MFIGPLKCFFFKVNLNLTSVRVCPQKLKSDPHLILLSVVDISVASFYFNPGYFALFCLFFNPKLFFR